MMRHYWANIVLRADCDDKRTDDFRTQAEAHAEDVTQARRQIIGDSLSMGFIVRDISDIVELKEKKA